MNLWMASLLLGIGATALIDLWSLVRRATLGVALPDYALVGRWLAHMRHGQVHHNAIKTSPAVAGERWLGWCAHYLTGIGFAALLVMLVGRSWLAQPTLYPAILVGTCTVIAPYGLMQPGMGLGFAAAKTPRPNSARLHSLITHLWFGLGLYLSAVLMNF